MQQCCLYILNTDKWTANMSKPTICHRMVWFMSKTRSLNASSSTTIADHDNTCCIEGFWTSWNEGWAIQQGNPIEVFDNSRCIESYQFISNSNLYHHVWIVSHLIKKNSSPIFRTFLVNFVNFYNWKTAFLKGFLECCMANYILFTLLQMSVQFQYNTKQMLALGIISFARRTRVISQAAKMNMALLY